MVDSFDQWHHVLEGSPHQVIIHSDHKNLSYFQTTQVLNRRQLGGLTNASAVFQHMPNDIFRDFLEIFLIIYLDDLLIYSKTQRDHDVHVRKVRERLRKYGLYAKHAKCSFDCEQVEFLG